jgi:carbonic anhydrase
VVPNLLTQTAPGEIFLVRNAGNIIPPYGASRGGEEAAIEFAVDGLKVTNIVICGHTHCGAMAALLTPEKLEHLPAMKKWLRHASATKKRVDILSKNKERSLIDVIQENIIVQAENLKTHPSVSAALLEKRVRIYGWVYHLESGRIDIYDPHHRRFMPSTDVKEEVSQDAAHFSL